MDLSERPFKLWVEDREDEEPILSESLIIATGATAKRMFLPGEDVYWQNGISACAVCDGAAPIFRNQSLAVIGGGDSACEEAMFLTKYASKVYLLVRRDEMRASKVMQDRVLKNDKITVLWSRIPIEAKGNGKLLTHLTLENTKNKQEKEDLEVSGLFYAIGHIPNTSMFQTNHGSRQLRLDADGYIFTTPGSTRTSIDGVFAAGDVQDKKYRQAVTAAGTGCMAALDVEKYLSEHESSQ
jgi:thioredoxin reductase (NADPH)